MIKLGPIVGHTTATASCVWVRATRDPSEYRLRVPGVGLFPFERTGPNADLYGTMIARAEGLRPDRSYAYQVLRRGRAEANGKGRFRTMPRPGDGLPQRVVFASCSHNDDLGAWPDLARFVRDAEPHAIFFIGDQVYQDGTAGSEGEGDVYNRHLAGSLKGPDGLAQALAGTYQHCWSRPDIAEILRSCPTYMMWDDHDIRDGWGSWASDSATVADRFPGAKAICEVDEAYFQGAREAAWNFQLCRNPDTFPRAGEGGKDARTTRRHPGGAFFRRTAFGFAVEIGRVAYVVCDSRGDRDLWREGPRSLGQDQWDCLEGYVANLSPEIDAAVFVTTVPIVSADPNGIAQSALKGRYEDYDLVRKGRVQEFRRLQRDGPSSEMIVQGLGMAPFALAGAALGSKAGITLGSSLTGFRHGDLDDGRDQWCQELSRPEQVRLIRLALRARTAGRPLGQPRSTMFVGGDLHTGARYTIRTKEADLTCLISSGISKEVSPWEAPLLVDESFDVAPGIHATRGEVVNVPNFGVVNVDCGPRPAQIASTLFYQSGRDATAMRYGGYLVTGDPLPEFYGRWLGKAASRLPL